MAQEQQRDPAAIEEDIVHTRSEMDETLNEIQQHLTPEMMLNQARAYLRANTGGGREFMDNLTESVRRNPIPMALIGVGVGWLMMTGRKGYRQMTNTHLPVPVDQSATTMATPTSEVQERSAAMRDDVERQGVTEEDRQARSQSPGSGMSRGL